jgi:glycosyltransferase involved in cell wall biosynthesis
VIATRGADLEEPFVHERNVFLCPPKDPEAMAASIEALITDPELARRLKAGASEFAENWFSWDKAIDHTLSALNGREQVS